MGAPGEDPQYIVTNCHVVEEFILAGKALGGGELYVMFDEDVQEEAYLVDYDYEKDIALLKLSDPTDQRSALSLREAEESELGSEVYAVGYPWRGPDGPVGHLCQQERRHCHHRQHQPLSDGERHRPQTHPDGRRPQRPATPAAP